MTNSWDGANVTIEFTALQCANLAELIELCIFDLIRSDPEIDNIEWIHRILDAQEVLKEAAKKAKEKE